MFYRGLHVINMQSVGCVCCVMMFLFLSLSFCSYLCLRRASFFIILTCRRLVLMVLLLHTAAIGKLSTKPTKKFCIMKRKAQCMGDRLFIMARAESMSCVDRPD